MKLARIVDSVDRLLIFRRFVDCSWKDRRLEEVEMTVGTAYRSGQAAQILRVSAHALRRLAEAGLVDADFTGSQWRFPAEEIQRLQREGLPPLPAMEEDRLRSVRSPQRGNGPGTEGLLATPSEELIADAEDLERKKLELQKLGVRRQIEEEMDFFREREQEEEDSEEQRRTRLQEQRHQQQREQVQAQEQRRRQRWQSQWVEHALRSMPYDAPEEMKLQVHKQVSETLAELNPGETRGVVRQLVEVATKKALKPWRRQQEIQKIIEDALPYSIKYTDYQPMAFRAAAEAISKLRSEATREELELAAKEAIEPFIVRQEHEKQCDRIASLVWTHLRGETSEVQDLVEEAVAQALKQLPMGCSEKMMQQARDQALLPVKKAIAEREEAAEALRQKQAAEAQRKREAEEVERSKQEEEARRKRDAEEALSRAGICVIWKIGHVDDYLRELGESKIEFEDVLDRLRLAEKFKKAIKPILVKALVQKPNLTDKQIHERIERLVDEHLGEELDEELEVDEAVEDRR